jgi:hypothetical protein
MRPASSTTFANLVAWTQNRKIERSMVNSFEAKAHIIMAEQVQKFIRLLLEGRNLAVNATDG